MDKDLANELSLGYVVFLDPRTLNTQGAKVSGPSDRWVTGEHAFLVIEAGEKKCRLVPMYSNTGPGRIEIDANARTGHEMWTKGSYHYHPVQVWTVSRQAVARAAAEARDHSRKGSRNLLARAYVPDIPAV